jgi:hypothetical protein
MDYSLASRQAMIKPLSPAAQAVLDAAINVAESPDAEAIAAAALRAAASIGDSYNYSSAEALDLILAIAAELEAQ